MNATVWYHASYIILTTDTDDDYLVLPAARICIAGRYYFTNRMPNYSKANHTPNWPILTEHNTLKTVVFYSSEAETGGTLKNAKNVTPLWHIIENIF